MFINIVRHRYYNILSLINKVLRMQNLSYNADINRKIYVFKRYALF